MVEDGKKRDRREHDRRVTDAPVAVDRREEARRKDSSISQARYCGTCGTPLNPPGSACPVC